MQQAQSDSRFQQRELPAQGRLRHLRPLRGGAEGTRVRHRDEVAELAKGNAGTK